MKAKLATLVACLACLAGCGPDYDHTEITNVKGSEPFPGTVTYARIVVPVGMLVTAHIVSYDDKHDTMSTGIQSKNTKIVEVEPVVSPDDYAFFGLATGSTDVELTANGKVVLIVTAIVTDQPALP